MSRLDAHYRETVDRYGYDRLTEGLGRIPVGRLRRRFVAVDDRAAVENAHERETLATTGVGMTGPPHLGTVGQAFNAVALQRAGLDVQFVLADLEPYHAGADLGRVRRLADRYRAFVRELGFDPERGRLRTQEEAREVMHTAELIAPYYRPEECDYHPDDPEPTEWWAAVEAAYEAADGERDPDDPDARTGPTSEAASAHSAVLHAADFVHPLRAEGYETVVVALGVDEHGLTTHARELLADLPVEGRIAGLHGRMVGGLGDAPKMGRSLPGSAVHLAMEPTRIRSLLTGPAADADHPADSPVFGAMCLDPTYDAERLDRLDAACRTDGDAWRAARERYAERVVDLAGTWQATAG
jgi:tryptophanyl-tRNA synthetase